MYLNCPILKRKIRYEKRLILRRNLTISGEIGQLNGALRYLSDCSFLRKKLDNQGTTPMVFSVETIK